MRMTAYDFVKRLLDFTGATLLGVFLAPALVGIGLAVLLADGRPVFFTQIRPGRAGQPFKLYKFRTMKGSNSPLKQMPERERVTRLGSVLRALSLDELPQLWNIARGDMSFVGPRPLLMDYLTLYNESQMRRHEVRPGLTGLAQVGGRNNLTWEEKFESDVKYADSYCFHLDLIILLRSFVAILAPKGIVPDEAEWVDPFRGSASQNVGD